MMQRAALSNLIERETARFRDDHPVAGRSYAESGRVLLSGVPMAWMSMWASPFPVVVDTAAGNRVVDVDGHEYLDFCLGDTAALAGHAPLAVADAVDRRFRSGTTMMLPTEDAQWVGRELARRFGLDLWQFALSATDANRWMLRIARHVTGRNKILVFNHNYHGTVDEVNLIIDEHGVTRTRAGNIGAPIDPRQTTSVVEWNDPEELERALAARDVACVLAEPALTNIGIVPPLPGFHQYLREATWRTGTLLFIDETHTFATGPGGGTQEYQLDPDGITLGKAIAGGVPIGAYGLTRALAERLDYASLELEDTGMIGGTLAGNALAMAAARATLEKALTDEAFASMCDVAAYFADSIRRVIDAAGVPWTITRLGARAEYRFCPQEPVSGAESAQAADPELDKYLHLYLINRRILTTPFHNMALMSPQTTEADVDRYVSCFKSAVVELLVEGIGASES